MPPTSIRPLLVLALTAGCGRISFSERADAGVVVDASPDGASCSFGPWSAPEAVPGLSSANEDWGPELAPDGLTMYLHSSRPGGLGNDDLWIAQRALPTTVFGAPTNLAALNTTASDNNVTLARDGTRLYFTSTRVTPTALFVSDGPPFTTATEVVSLANGVLGPAVANDDLELFFTRAGIERAVRATTTEPWSVTGPVPELVVPGTFGFPSMSADGTTMFFESQVTPSETVIYTAQRSGRGAVFSTPALVDDLNLAGTASTDPWIAPDGLTIYFGSDRPGSMGLADIFTSRRTCL